MGSAMTVEALEPVVRSLCGTCYALIGSWRDYDEEDLSDESAAVRSLLMFVTELRNQAELEKDADSCVKADMLLDCLRSAGDALQRHFKRLADREIERAKYRAEREKREAEIEEQKRNGTWIEPPPSLSSSTTSICVTTLDLSADAP